MSVFLRFSAALVRKAVSLTSARGSGRLLGTGNTKTANQLELLIAPQQNDSGADAPGWVREAAGRAGGELLVDTVETLAKQT